jgi:hypothetical protein
MYSSEAEPALQLARFFAIRCKSIVSSPLNQLVDVFQQQNAPSYAQSAVRATLFFGVHGVMTPIPTQKAPYSQVYKGRMIVLNFLLRLHVSI